MHVLSSLFKANKSTKWLAAVSILAALSFGGCQVADVKPTAGAFASLRVMNFAPLPAGNVDVYWYKPESVPDPSKLRLQDANVHSLMYGGGAIYTDGIEAAAGGTRYHYRVTVANAPEKLDVEGDMLLMPGTNYTLIIIQDPASQLFSARVITDAKDAKVQNTADPSSTFVRLMNLQRGSGKIILHVNDPISGEVIGRLHDQDGIDFDSVSDYYAFKTAPDTSYTFYLTPLGSSQILARLTYQTYTKGDYFTLVYAGDPARVPGDLSNFDTGQAKVDQIRLRVFPDNNVGADQTNPLDSAFRYNVINGVFPVGGNGYIDGQTALGITVNGEAVPYRHNFTMWPVDMFTPSGSNPLLIRQKDGLYDSVWNVHFLSTNIPTHTIEVKGTAVDNAGKTHQVFSLSGTTGINQTLLNADTTLSFLLLNGNVDPAKGVKPYTVGIPNSVSSDSVTIVFVSGISLPVGGTPPAATFHLVAGAGATTYDTRRLAVGTSENVTIGKDDAASITITDDIGKPGVGSEYKQNINTVHFSAEAGGIYEVVSAGVRPEILQDGTRILVIQTNKK